MKTLDYMSSKEPVFPTWLTRWIKRIFLLTTIIIVICAAAIAISLQRSENADLRDIKKFEQSTSEVKLKGKTTEQIIILLGKPSFDSRVDRGIGHRDTDASYLMEYEGPWGARCRIEITNGVATAVEHHGK